MEIHDWITFGSFMLAIAAAFAGIVRYFDKQMADKLSIGEYERRHGDLERRVRLVERWQDRANGHYHADTRFTKEGDEYG